MLRGIGLLGFMSSGAWAAGRAPQVPQAIVLAGGGSEVLTEMAESPVPVLPGMALYQNDHIRSAAEPVTIWMCGSGEIDELLPGKGLTMGASGPIADAGALRMKERSTPCQLPAIERGQVSSYSIQTRSRGTPQGGGGSATSELSANAREAIAPVRARVEQDPNSLPARVALAELLSRYGRAGEALVEYERLGDEFAGAVWTRGVVTRLQREQMAASSGTTGETYALLIGISQYASPAVPSLMFADRDAETFAEFLQTPRGGGLPKNHILLLTNGKATRDAIDDGLSTFLEGKAGAANTLILFVAAHGVSVPTEQDPQTRRVMLKEPYILTTESNPEETKTSGYPMAAFGELIAQEGQRFGKVLVYVDVCRAGNIKGLTGAPRELEPQVQDAFNRGKGDVGVLLATDARHDAFESELIGNGHGAFTYSVLDALNGSAVPSGEDRIEFYDLRHYVEEHVRLLTSGNQTPVYIETDPNMLISEHLKEKAGIQLPPAQKIPMQRVQRRGQAGRASAPPIAQTAGAGISENDAGLFEEALTANRLLPEENGAVQILGRLQQQADQSDAANFERARRLRTALEDRGQAVLLLYLRGDQIPQTRAAFDKGARYFEEALRLAPGAVFDESRLYFCRGRALIFAKQYEAAKQWLGRSILLDPLRAYAYNALGIAYLEEIPNDPNNYTRAMAAFRDAIRYAPLWTYPLHNLALTQMQHGDYDMALGTYRDAMRLAPEASYLPYNTGLLYQKINRTKEAYDSYRNALRAVEALPAPEEVRGPRSTIYNALGSLEAMGSRAKQAEQYFRLAIADSPVSLNAKHNLALLLSRKTASPEAEALWNECLAADPAYLPARLSLAEYLAREKRLEESARQYRLLLDQTPQFAAGRLAFVKLLESQGKTGDAIEQLEIVTRSPQAGANVFEELGDMELKSGNREAARRAYESGEKIANAGEAHRLKRKAASAFDLIKSSQPSKPQHSTSLDFAHFGSPWLSTPGFPSSDHSIRSRVQLDDGKTHHPLRNKAEEYKTTNHVHGIERAMEELRFSTGADESENLGQVFHAGLL